MSTGMRVNRSHVGNEVYEDRVVCGRRVNARAVPCPSCPAVVDEECRTVAGTPTKNHPSRRRLAIKRMWEAGEMGRATTLPLPTPRKLRVMRRALGLSRRALAGQLNVPEHAVTQAENGRLAAGEPATAIAEWFDHVTRRAPR